MAARAPSSALAATANAVLPACEKHEYIGAVTLVHFSTDGSLLYVGVGSTLFLYETSTGDLIAQHDILARGILHGCDFVPSVVGDAEIRNVAVFFGQKRVACLHNLPQTPDEAITQQTLECFAGKRTTKVFGDWVFDVQILSEEANPYSKFPLLAVGLAHNFIQIWEPKHDRVMRTVQCAERCILYALAFHGRSAEELVVASGTVFQQILLWKPVSSNTSSTSSGEDEDAIIPAQRLHSHDGVLFKLEWSSDASMLASVSDDRTVQLWSNREATEFPEKNTLRDDGGFFKSTEQTIAFMDIVAKRANTEPPTSVDLAKEYRSLFRSWGHTARLWDVKFCAYGLATTSEDSICKIWDFAGNCIASLQGHMGKHVWRVAIHPSQAIIATGGTDGAAKLWNLHDQIKSTSANSNAFCQSIPLFTQENSHLHEKKKSQKKTKGKSKTLSIRDIVVNQSNGETGYVASELGQIFEVDLKAQTSSLFYSIPNEEEERDGDDSDEEKASSTPPSNLSTFTTDSLNQVLLAGSSSGVVSIIDIETATLSHSWKAHDSRVVKIFWTREAKDDTSSSLFTVCADCTIREWRPVIVAGGSESDNVRMELLTAFKSPGKCSASALLVVDRGETRNILCGDGRGNLFVFRRALELINNAESIDEPAQTPSLVLKSVHGREQVTSLLIRDNVVLSGGHDGYICSYLADLSQVDGALSLTFIGHDSIKGMTTIKSLWYNANNELFVLGFYASQAILHNFSAQYRLFSIECGGWRRPHALVTKDVNNSVSLPAHTFLFTPPVANKADLLELKVHSTITQKAPAFQQPVLGRTSLHHLFHGKMTTCVAKIGDRLVTAAEDNSVKLHKQVATLESKNKVSWECVSTGVAHTTTVRAMTSFRVHSAHFLLSGGGKQRINVWKVADQVDVIEHVCGFEKEDSLQDHRILGLETFAIRPNAQGDDGRYRLVTACNSEGSIQLLLLDIVEGKLMELGEVSSSKKPILTCAGLQRFGGSGDVAVLAVGSTDGMINIWDFGGIVRDLAGLELDVLDPQQFQTSAKLADLTPRASYLAHDMGVNCLTIAHQHQHNDIELFSIISGGDDQNVRLREFKIKSLLKGENGDDDNSVVSDTCAINASGSAIKTIFSDGNVVFIAGYDQRVSKWAVVSNDGPEDRKSWKKSLQWQCAAFSECADIADIAVWEEMDSSSSISDASGAQVVVVVGQGLQTIRFCK